MTTTAGRYRKKPVVVAAVQWTGGNAADLRAFAGVDFQIIDGPDRVDDPTYTAEVFDRLHGTWSPIRVGDWVIRGPRGGHYPCEGQAFVGTYEPVDGG